MGILLDDKESETDEETNEYYEKKYHQIYSNKNLWSGKFYGKKF